MSEEEIIEIIEAVSKKSEYWLTTKQFDALVGLFDLYNKQKEENKKDIKGYSKMINSLEEQLAHKTKEIKELNSEFALNTEIHKRDEEIKELKDTIKCLHEPAENYISKDKIRDKIKEITDKTANIGLFIDKETSIIANAKREVLNELLEEE